MILNRTHQDALRDLLKLVGTTQKVLADEIDYAASALSEALRLTDPKSINEAKWDEIVGFFEKRIEAAKADLERRSLLTRAEQLLQELRSGSAGPTIHIPGGPLPANATNYVERPSCDGLLFHSRVINVTEQPSSFPAILIRGGIQSGRSSLLQRLAWATSRAGHDSRSVDMSKIVAGLRSATFPPGHLSNHMFRLVFEKFFENGERLQLAISQTSEFQLGPWVSAFLELASDLSKHTFFVLDSVDDILRLNDGARSFNDLSLFLSTIREDRPDYVSTAIVFSTSAWRYLHGSPYANAAIEVLTPPFNEMMIVDLLQKLSVATRGTTSGVPKVLFNAFRGQPHLTHLAAFMLKNQSSGVDDVLPRILGEAGLQLASDNEVSVDHDGAVSGPYRTHWERMRRHIQYLLRELEPSEQRSADDPAAEDRRVVELGSLLHDVLAMVDDRQATQSAPLFDRLQTLGLLQGPYPGLLPPFYRAAIQTDSAYRRVAG